MQWACRLCSMRPQIQLCIGYSLISGPSEAWESVDDKLKKKPITLYM